MAFASWSGTPPFRARGRAPIFALTLVACSLLWAGSAPAGPNLQFDETAAAGPEDESDTGSDVPLAPPEVDETPNDQQDDTPTEGPAAHSLPMPHLTAADEVADMPVTQHDSEPPLSEPRALRDPPRRARLQPPGTQSATAASSSTSTPRTSHDLPHCQGVPQEQQQGLPPPTEPLPLQDPGLQHQGPHQGQLSGGPDGTFTTWSAWDEEYDNPPDQQPQAFSQPPPLRPSTMPSSSTFRLGYANSYDPDTDPWHEEGQLDSDELHHGPMTPYLANNNNFDPRPPRPTQSPQIQGPQLQHQYPAQHHLQQGPPQPPTADTWHNLARDLASTGPLLPPQQWAHINAMSPQPPTTSDADAHVALPSHGYDQEANAPQQLPSGDLVPEACDEECAAQLPEQTAQEPELQGSPPLPERDLRPPQASDPRAAQEAHQNIENADQPEAGGDPAGKTDAGEEEEVEEDDEEGDMEWDSDESDDEGDAAAHGTIAGDATQQQQRGKPQNHQQQQQQRRQAGHGSQRVKNKQRKSDVKRLWREAGWGDKPDWLSWKAALGWLKRGVCPPAKRPASNPEDRARLASLLTAHHYTRDASGAIIPSGATGTSSVPQAAQEPQLPQAPPLPQQGPAAQPVHDPGSKADTQADQDHQRREAANPYLNPSGTQHSPAVASARTETRAQSYEPREPQLPPPPQHDVPGKAEAQARQDHQDRQATNPYLQPADRRPRQAPALSSYDDNSQKVPAGKTGSKQLSFQLPDDHREDPPKPTRTQHVLRKLSDSTMVQITGDGLSQYPVRIVDNRPHYMQLPSSVPDGVEQGGTLFAQPSHLTSATAPSSSASAIMHSGGRPHNVEPDPLDTADLDLEANRAVAQGQAPAWSISSHEPTARASIRVDEISLDIAWTPGAGPPTIPPSITSCAAYGPYAERECSWCVEGPRVDAKTRGCHQASSTRGCSSHDSGVQATKYASKRASLTVRASV